MSGHGPQLTFVSENKLFFFFLLVDYDGNLRLVSENEKNAKKEEKSKKKYEYIFFLKQYISV